MRTNSEYVYYTVHDPEIIERIAVDGVIGRSLESQVHKEGEPSQYYIQLLKDITSVARIGKKRTYGVRLDLRKLRNQYEIEPYTYLGTPVGTDKHFYVKYLIEYDNESAAISLVGWPVVDISWKAFKELQHMIVYDVQGINKSRPMTVSRGRRRYCGRMVVAKYNYGGSKGLHISANTVSSETFDEITKHTTLSDTEERLWLEGDTRYINVSDCITGYLAPAGSHGVKQKVDNGVIPSHGIVYY